MKRLFLKRKTNVNLKSVFNSRLFDETFKRTRLNDDLLLFRNDNTKLNELS